MWQWCEDWWNGEEKYRVLRGASWDVSLPDALLSSCRLRTPGDRDVRNGFRCVLVVESSRWAGRVSALAALGFDVWVLNLEFGELKNEQFDNKKSAIPGQRRPLSFHHKCTSQRRPMNLPLEMVL